MARKTRSKVSKALNRAKKASSRRKSSSAKKKATKATKSAKPKQASQPAQADPQLVQSLLNRIESLEARERSQSAPMPPVAPPSLGGSSTPSAVRPSSRVNDILEFHANKDDIAAQQETKAQRAILKAKNGQFVPCDNLFLAALKQCGDHLFDESNQRRAKNPKVVRGMELIRSVALDSKVRHAETASPQIAADRLEYIELVSELCSRYNVPAVIRFDEWNRMTAAANRRMLMDFSTVQYTKIFAGNAIRSSPKKSAKQSRSNGSSKPNRRSGRGGVQPICLDFLNGHCSRGAACRYRHIEAKKTNDTRRRPRDGRE